MESQKEIRRSRIYRAIALTISLAVHLALAYYFFGSDLTDQPKDNTLVMVDSK